MTDDSFEVVAITYNQPETSTLLSMLAYNGIAAQALGSGHARADATIMVALGGIRILVPTAAAGEARALLADIRSRPAAIRPRLFDPAWLNAIIVIIACVVGVPVPPTRTPSTLFVEQHA